MKIKLKTKYIDSEAVVTFARYREDNSIAIILHTPNGEPLAKATVCLKEYGYVPDYNDYQVFIKDYSEGEGMFEGLIKAGIITLVEKGFLKILDFSSIKVPVGRLTSAAQHAFIASELPK